MLSNTVELIGGAFGVLGSTLLALVVKHRYFFDLVDANAERRLEWIDRAKKLSEISEDETNLLSREEERICLHKALYINADQVKRKLIVQAQLQAVGRVNNRHFVNAYSYVNVKFPTDEGADKPELDSHWSLFDWLLLILHVIPPLLLFFMFWYLMLIVDGSLLARSLLSTISIILMIAAFRPATDSVSTYYVKQEILRQGSNRKLNYKRNDRKGISLLPVCFFVSVAGIIMSGYAVYCYRAAFETLYPAGIASDSVGSLRAAWGTTGDFIGGVVGSICAGCGLVLLMATLYTNTKELEHTRIELEKTSEALKDQKETSKLQRFETTFFSMLNEHNRLLAGITSRKTIPQMFTDGFTQEYSDVEKFFNNNKEHINADSAATLKQTLMRDDNLNQYFRVLYQLLKFIYINSPEESNNVQRTFKNIEQIAIKPMEKQYSNMVRAFIPNNGLLLMAINCIYNNNDQFERYARLIERYSFFEHMNLSYTPPPYLCEVIQLYKSEAFGENENYSTVRHIKKG